MKIKKDDIDTLNKIRFGPANEARPGSQWLLIEGFKGINYMTQGAYLFDHELGQCWVPKAAVKFELKIGCDPTEPEYRVFLASWFNWTEKVELMQQGKLMSDQVAQERMGMSARVRAMAERKFSKDPMVDFLPKPPKAVEPTPLMVDWIEGKTKDERVKNRTGIDFKKINLEREIDDAIRDMNAMEINNARPAVKVKVAIRLFKALKRFKKAGYTLQSNWEDLYEKCEELLENIEKKARKKRNEQIFSPSKKKEEKPNMLGDRAIDL